MEDNNLLQDVGGRAVLEKVHKLFYDKLYEHPWLKKFFLHIEQKLIENQQTDFMVSNMGGGKFIPAACRRGSTGICISPKSYLICVPKF